jgi:hypothetical protein
MSAILHPAFTQSAEELFNIEGQAFPLRGSDPFHRNRRHRSEDSIRNLFILDPRSQLLVRGGLGPRGVIAIYTASIKELSAVFSCDDGDRTGEDLRWCRDEETDISAGPDMSTQRPNVALSENARKQLQQQLELRH